ncbi:MAG: tyrosine-type recombinase/integrase [Thermoplasmatales archaeon]|nr:tyrosine-type recombinase/integrase [Thermoplasmatales archaeon]
MINLTRKEIPKYEIIEKFLKRITKSNKTRMAYRSHLMYFFKTIDVDNPNNYLKSKRNYVKDIWDLAYSIENRPTKTQSAIISCVKKFLTRNGVEIKEMEWEDIRTRSNLGRARAITEKVIPTANQLKQILQHGNLKSKTLFIFMAANGCRIEETLLLTWDNIDLETRRVHLPASITKKRVWERDTFFTVEAKEYLEAWKKERDAYITHGFKKSRFVRNQLAKQGYEFKKKGRTWEILKDGKEVPIEEMIKLEKRIFPFSVDNASKTWNGLLEKAGAPFNDKDNNQKLKYPRYKYHIHTIRGFWFTSFANTEANQNHINKIGAHESELKAAYTDFPINKLKETYDKYCGCVSIFESQPDLTGVHEELKNKEVQISTMQQEIHNLRNQISGFQNVLEDPEFRNKLNEMLALTWEKYMKMKEKKKP